MTDFFSITGFPRTDLRPERMKQAAAEMIAFRPDYFLGYSVALDRFARGNEGMADQFRALQLKAVIGTSESFPGPESAVRLSNLLGAPIAMEYGAVETNVIAHTHPSGGYRVFWRTYLVEALPVAGTRRCRVLITSLYPRCFPLVRYEIGDEIEVEDTQSAAAGVLRFCGSHGRRTIRSGWKMGQSSTLRRLAMRYVWNVRFGVSR